MSKETKNPQRVRAVHYYLRNIMRFEEKEFEFGDSWTEISGRNEEGKTSIIESIRGLLGGGHDATLLRKGADEGEMVMLLEDDREIRKTVRADKSDLKVRHPSMGTISAAQTHLNKITDALGLNVPQFIMAKPADRRQYLLESLPLELDAEQLKRAIGDAAELPEVIEDHHALELVEDLYDELYTRRRDVNRELSDKEGAYEELNEAIEVTEDPEEVNEKLSSAREDERELTKKKSEAEKKVAERHELKRKKLEQEFKQRAAKLEEERKADLGDVHGEFTDKIKEVETKITQLQEQLRIAERMDTTRERAERVAGEVKELEKKTMDLSMRLEDLKNIKKNLLSDLPFEGMTLEGEDGDIHIDGVPWKRVNTANQVRIAIEIANLRSGDLGLVVADGLECLDEQQFEALREWVEESDIQLVVGRVANEDLTITTD